MTQRMGDAFEQQEVPGGFNPARDIHVEILLDNIRSSWNVGSILRAADGAGVKMVYVCGVSPSPDQVKVGKTALGAERVVPWQIHRDAVELCQHLKANGTRIWALEGGNRAENIFQVEIPCDHPLLLVVGNEVCGIDPDIIAMCERVVCLPMLGQKGSLHVAGAFTAAIYAIRFGNYPR